MLVHNTLQFTLCATPVEISGLVLAYSPYISSLLVPLMWE